MALFIAGLAIVPPQWLRPGVPSLEPQRASGRVVAVDGDLASISLGFNSGVSYDRPVAIMRGNVHITNCIVEISQSGFSAVRIPFGVTVEVNDEVALFE